MVFAETCFEQLAPERVEHLDDLNPVIELYHHTVRAGQYDEAYRLFRNHIDTPSYYQFGAYQLQTELLRALFPDGEDKLLAKIKEEPENGFLYNRLANIYEKSGMIEKAIECFNEAVRRNPQDFASWLQLAHANLDRGEFSEFLRLLDYR